MSELDFINSTPYIDAVIDLIQTEIDEAPVDENYTNPLNYNLIEDATVECLFGECDHFCGEPTEYDLERLERRGFSEAVDAYEHNTRFQLI